MEQQIKGFPTIDESSQTETRKAPEKSKMQEEMELFKMQMAYIDSLQNPRPRTPQKKQDEKPKEKAIEVVKAKNPAEVYFINSSSGGNVKNKVWNRFMWLLHSTSKLTSVPVCFTSTGTSLSKTYIFFLSAFTKEKQKASTIPEITILVAKQPMDKIPANLILFSKFLIIMIM